jgi:hypothetical protein
MQGYLAKLNPKTRMALAVSLVIAAYPIVMMIIPAILRAIVPDAVRSVLSLM